MRCLVLVALLVSSCQYSETGKTCSAGVGLRATPYSGTQLADHQLALTFDGPASDVAASLGSLLADNAVQGAFFISGGSLAEGSRTGVMTALKQQAHLVGNHGYTNSPLTLAVDPEREVRKTDALIAPYVTGNMFLFRPQLPSPANVAMRLNNAGLTRYVGPIAPGIGAGSLVTDDQCWANGAMPTDCANGYLNAIKGQGHGLVLMHTNDMNSVTMLRYLLSQLKTNGFTFVRLDVDPEIKTALLRSGGQPGATGGAPGCSEY